jgi:hypothetical protein
MPLKLAANGARDVAGRLHQREASSHLSLAESIHKDDRSAPMNLLQNARFNVSSEGTVDVRIPDMFSAGSSSSKVGVIDRL